MKQFNFQTIDGVQVTISVNPAGFVQVSSQGKSRSMALPRFARTLHANPSAVSAEPLEDAVRLVLADGSAWIIFADTLHIAEEPRSVTEEFEEQRQQTIAAAAATEPESGNGATQPAPEAGGVKPVKIGGRKAAFFEALEKILADRGFSKDEIQSILVQLSAKRNGMRQQIDTSTPEGKLQAALRQLFFYLKRNAVTRYSSDAIQYDGHRIVLTLPDGNSIAYPQ